MLHDGGRPRDDNSPRRAANPAALVRLRGKSVHSVHAVTKRAIALASVTPSIVARRADDLDAGAQGGVRYAGRMGMAISRSALCAVIVLVGCGSHEVNPLPGPMSGSSVSGSGSGSGAASTGAASSSGSGGDAGALVAQCQALAMGFVANCNNEFGPDGGRNPDTARVCIWTAYSHLCATGNAKLLIDSMNCFNGNPSCWTFSDCNTACSCLDSLHAAEAPSATLSLLRTQCTACGDTNCASVIGEAEVIPYLADPTIAVLAACAGDPCTNGDAGAHCHSLIPNVSDFSCE